MEKEKPKYKETTYKDYVKKEMIEKFEKHCKVNCLDFYSCGCVLTAHLVLKDLMRHTFEGPIKEDKCSPKEAWDNAMEETPYHSGYSAGTTAIIVAVYSPRGDEFKEWCKKENIVMVKWN